MAPVLRNIILFAALVLPAVAVPTVDTQTQTINHHSVNQFTESKTIFQRLRDGLIEKIWNVPKKSDCHHKGPRTKYTAPSNFRSKYGRDVVLRFQIKTEEEAKAFSEAVSVLYLDVWDYSADWVDVRIAKTVVPALLNLLPSSLQNSHTSLMHDLAQAVYDTYPASAEAESWRTKHHKTPPKTLDLLFQDYQPLSVIRPMIHLLSELYRDHVEAFTIGQSAEGRDILGIRVGAPVQDQIPDIEGTGRPTILIVGGSHAREWISTSTVMWVAFSFATRYGLAHFPALTDTLKHYDILFIPVLNPDGYEYTWTHDRLWRKNRQSTTLPFCPGIDLDRSFGFQWDGDEEIDNPCTETFAGEHAFEAVEAKVLADWAINQTRDNDVSFVSFIDLHSYSQKVLFPYSYTCDVDPPSIEVLEEVAMGFAKSFRLTAGHFYDVGSACESQFALKADKDGKRTRQRIDGTNNNGGSAIDYFYNNLGIRFTYQIKLRDTGSYGFLLPKENIIPTGRETFEAIVGFGRWLLSNRGVELLEEDIEPSEETTTTQPLDEDHSMHRWKSQRPESLFRISQEYTDSLSDKQVDKVAADDKDNDDEWERVFDQELRRRR